MIPTGRSACGHVLKICTRCMHTGCKDTNCPHCIGGNTGAYCAVCGGATAIDMADYLDRKRYNNTVLNQENEDINHRINALENANGISFNTGSRQSQQIHDQRSGGILSTMFSLFMLSMVCYVVTRMGLHAEDYNSEVKFLVQAINMMGEFGISIVKFFAKIIF